jgi:kumamolisin
MQPERQQLTGHVAPVFASLPSVGPVDGDTEFTSFAYLAVPDLHALRNAVAAVSDPRHPSFRHYLKPEEFADRFGVTEAQYRRVGDWARRNNLDVTTYRNRLVLGVRGKAADLERAAHTTLTYRLRSDGSRFYAPDREPSLDIDVPMVHLSNLDNFDRPTPNYTPNGSGATECSGGYAFTGGDIRAAYLYPAASGSGQKVAVIDPVTPGGGCVQQSDINIYASLSGVNNTQALQYNDVNLSECYQNGVWVPSGESTIDAEMVTIMAPSAQVFVFGATGTSPPCQWRRIRGRVSKYRRKREHLSRVALLERFLPSRA